MRAPHFTHAPSLITKHNTTWYLKPVLLPLYVMDAGITHWFRTKPPSRPILPLPCQESTSLSYSSFRIFAMNHDIHTHSASLVFSIQPHRLSQWGIDDNAQIKGFGFSNKQPAWASRWQQCRQSTTGSVTWVNKLRFLDICTFYSIALIINGEYI